MRSVHIDWHKWVGLPLNILLFIGALVFMQMISDLRLKELHLSLQDMNEQSIIGASDPLLVRYQTLSRESFDEQKAELNEAKLIALFAESRDAQGNGNESSLLERSAIFFINAINRIVGNKPFLGTDFNESRRLLHAAYYFERKREFAKALTLYSSALSHYDGFPAEQAYIHLHRGFCNALLGRRSAALNDLNWVRKEAADSSSAVVAGRLLGLLREADKQEKNIDLQRDTLNKGVAYYQAIAYHKAIGTFSRIEERYRGAARQKLLFYRGRSYEEIGQIESALADYRSLRALGHSSTWSTKAGKRIRILSNFYDVRDRLPRSATVTSTDSTPTSSRLDDETIDRIFEDYYKTVATNVDADEVMRRLQRGEVSDERAEAETLTAELTEQSAAQLKKSVETRQKLLSSYKELDLIQTVNGSQLRGIIFRERKSHIDFLTSYGIVEIPIDKIASRNKIPNDNHDNK